MTTFVCGQGPGAEGVLEHLLMTGYKVQVFSHPGKAGRQMLERSALAGMPGTFGSVNDRSSWAYAPTLPGLLVSIGYLTVVKPDVLAQVSGRAINCHYALLPNHKGRSAVPWAIIEGDRLTGVTWHWMTEKVDEGNVLLQATCQIDPHETQASLFAKLHRLAVATAPAAIRMARAGWDGWPQQGRGQYHKPGPPHGGAIDDQWRDDYIERFIRAMTYPPLAYATYRRQEVKSMEDFYRLAQEGARRDLVL